MAYAPNEQLELLLSSNPTATSAEARLLLTRLSAEIKSRVERASTDSFDFFVNTSDVLGGIKGTGHATLRMRCLWDCCNFFQACGHSRDALGTAQHLENLAIKANDKHWLRKSYGVSGVARAENGDVGGALIHYEKALTLAGSESCIAQSSTLNNIGVALNYCSLHREAIPCFQKADWLARSEPNAPDSSQLSVAALGNIAQSYLLLEEYSLGYEAIQLALEHPVTVFNFRTAISRAIRESTYVQLALGLGKLEEARRHAIECRKHGRWGGNPRGLVLANIAEGLCEVFGGDVGKGVSMLESSLPQANDDAQREDLLRALVRAHDELGHDDRALLYLRELRSVLRARAEKGVFALFSFHSGSAERQVLTGAKPNFTPLELREARLRVRIAEREAAESQIEMLERLAVTADLREEPSGEHGYRVGKLSALLAENVGLRPDVCSAIEIAARLHDIGKIGIPDRILLTSERLRENERELMSAHALIGAELLARSQLPQLRLAEGIARHHHERWDGTGYPSKLKGRRIPLEARIVAIADVFDALTHGRPYAAAWSIEQAIGEIKSRRGSFFDPDLTDRFLELIAALRSLHPDLDAYLGRAGRASPFAQARQRIRAMLKNSDNRATAVNRDSVH